MSIGLVEPDATLFGVCSVPNAPTFGGCVGSRI
jgi:hypothetical protein